MAAPPTPDPAPDDLARGLASPRGEVWIPVNGGSLAPVARPGDRALLRACDAAALRRGDLAVTWWAGAWAVRLVTSTHPLRTAAMTAVPGPEAGVVRGRVVALERGGRRRRYAVAARLRALLLHSLRSSRAAHAAHAALRRARAARVVRRLRAWLLGPVVVRRLGEPDGAELRRFASRHLPRRVGFLDGRLAGRWSTAGVALGAFTARGRMIGFVYLDEYRAEDVDLPGWWVRSLLVAPAVRHLGVARRLLLALREGARAAGLREIHADVRADNRASLRAFRGLGFVDADPGLVARAGEVLAPRHGGRALVVLQADTAGHGLRDRP
jgi:L-amino acid N-acyltransferase YncA